MWQFFNSLRAKDTMSNAAYSLPVTQSRLHSQLGKNLSPYVSLPASDPTSIARPVLYFFSATLISQGEGGKGGTHDEKAHDMPGVLYLVLCVRM